MRFNKRNPLLLAVLLTGTLIGCAKSPEERFRTKAQQLRLRLMPAKGTGSEPAVTRSGTAISAEWDIRTDLKPDGLEEWLSKALKPDFAKTVTEGDRLCFAKYEDGESGRLEITFSEAAGRTIAHVRFKIAPD